MTDKIFDLKIKLIADDDRARKQDQKLLEYLLEKSIKQVLPESIVLKVSISESGKKK